MLSDPGTSLRSLVHFREELQVVTTQSEIEVASREMPHRVVCLWKLFLTRVHLSEASITRNERSLLLFQINCYSGRVVSGVHKGLTEIWSSDEQFSYSAWSHCPDIGLPVPHCDNSRRLYTSLSQRTLPCGLPILPLTSNGRHQWVKSEYSSTSTSARGSA